MPHSAKILADSVDPKGAARLTTFEVTFPRCILAELNTHRAFSRNSASSRAIPVEKMIERVQIDPFIPSEFTINKKGMSGDTVMDGDDLAKTHYEWLTARNGAVQAAKRFAQLGLHKGYANRVLEPFLWHTAIISATDWDNFFHQRLSKNAHPEIRILAEMMDAALHASTPKVVDYGGWHTPLIFEDDSELVVEYLTKRYLNSPAYKIGVKFEADAFTVLEEIKRISVARCARVSYLTHDGKRSVGADIDLFDNTLRSNGHWSPMEHVATPAHRDPAKSHMAQYGNFAKPWMQYRKFFTGENVVFAPHNAR